MAYEKELNLLRYQKDACTDLSEEFVLSDYQTDIRKILSCKETVLPPSKYIGPDGTDINGGVNYKLLYLGTDNKLYSADFSAEYGIVIPSDANIDPSVLSDITNVRSEGVNIRQLSPKKIAVRNRICATAFAFGSAEKSECMTDKFIPADCEALTENIEYMHSASASGDILGLSDEFISEIHGDTARVIMTEGTVFIQDVVCADSKLSVRGELIADVLMCDDTSNEIPKLTRRKIPFSQDIDCAACTSESIATVNGLCTEINATPEDSRITLTAYCLCEATVLCSAKEQVCTDIYSPTHRLTTEKNNIRLARPLICGNGNVSVNGSFSASDIGISPTSRIIYAQGFANAEKLNISEENGRATVTGNCRFRLITLDDTDEIPDIDAKDVNLPFKYEFMRDSVIPTSADKIEFSSNTVLSRVSARFDGERAGIDAELSIALSAFERTESEVIGDAVFGEELIREKGCIRIVYPSANETLWSLAKGVNARIDSLCTANGITIPENASDTHSLNGCKFVIV